MFIRDFFILTAIEQTVWLDLRYPIKTPWHKRPISGDYSSSAVVTRAWLQDLH